MDRLLFLLTFEVVYYEDQAIDWDRQRASRKLEKITKKRVEEFQPNCVAHCRSGKTQEQHGDQTRKKVSTQKRRRGKKKSGGTEEKRQKVSHS